MDDSEAPSLARQITQAVHEWQIRPLFAASAPRPGWESLPEVATASRLRGEARQMLDVRLFLTFTSRCEPTATYLTACLLRLSSGGMTCSGQRGFPHVPAAEREKAVEAMI